MRVSFGNSGAHDISAIFRGLQDKKVAIEWRQQIVCRTVLHRTPKYQSQRLIQIPDDSSELTLAAQHGIDLEISIDGHFLNQAVGSQVKRD